jgi:hypothetical protein
MVLVVLVVLVESFESTTTTTKKKDRFQSQKRPGCLLQCHYLLMLPSVLRQTFSSFVSSVVS